MIRGGETPVHLLWARERMRDLEEGAAEHFKRGSGQAQGTEKQTRDEIIRLSREFGVLSRETCFVAVEKIPLDGGEAILGKVPVMLAEGWGGVERVIAVQEMQGLMIDRMVGELFKPVKPGAWE